MFKISFKFPRGQWVNNQSPGSYRHVTWNTMLQWRFFLFYFKFPLWVVAIFSEGPGVNHGIKIRVPGCTNPSHASTYWSAPGGGVWKNSGYKLLPCWTPDMGWMDANWWRSTWWLQMAWHQISAKPQAAGGDVWKKSGCKLLPCWSPIMDWMDTNWYRLTWWLQMSWHQVGARPSATTLLA